MAFPASPQGCLLFSPYTALLSRQSPFLVVSPAVLKLRISHPWNGNDKGALGVYFRVLLFMRTSRKDLERSFLAVPATLLLPSKSTP